MQQLITIETVPISVKYSGTQPVPVLQEAKSQEKTSENGKVRHGASTSQNNAPVKVHGLDNGLKQRTDSYLASNSAGAPFNLTYTATSKFDEKGKLNINIKMGNTDILSQRHFGKDIHNILDQVFGNRQSSSLSLNEMKLNIDFGDLHKAAPGSGNSDVNYNLPDFEIEILEMPKVIIKYIGGPIYIPRSADPDYEALPWEE